MLIYLVEKLVIILHIFSVLVVLKINKVTDLNTHFVYLEDM